MLSSVKKKYNINITGRGNKTMLFAHGFGCDQNSWKYITGAFAEDYKIVLFDYIGAGQSDISAYDEHKYSSLEGYAEDILEICNTLDLRDVIFVGHSVSAIIGVLAANKQPKLFDRLIMLGPSPRYVNDRDYKGGFEKIEIEGLLQSMDENFTAWSAAMAPKIMANPERPELGEFLTKSFCSMDAEIGKRFARVTFLSDNREDLEKLKVRSLTIQSKEDIIAPMAVGKFVHENTPGNKLVVIESSGHCLHLSSPEKTIEAIKNFIITE